MLDYDETLASKSKDSDDEELASTESDIHSASECDSDEELAHVHHAHS